MDRRTVLAGCGAALASGVLGSGALHAAAPFVPAGGPRSRVLYVNDLAGDVDGLFATVHAVLSRSIDMRGIVTTAAAMPGESAAAAAAIARDLLKVMGRAGTIAVHEGAAARLKTASEPDRSPGTMAIIAEAMREDSPLPLYIAVGGGLTELASALIIEPRIAGRFTLVWIGGIAQGAGDRVEYNFALDPLAAMHVFNETQAAVWQVSNAVYAQCGVSVTEMQARVAPHGAIGKWLYDKALESSARMTKIFNTGETWVLGDSPLVLLTALSAAVPSGMDFKTRQFRFERTGGSFYDELITPTLNRDASWTPRPEGRKMRAYTTVNTRLMFEDFYAKLAMNARGGR